MDNLTLYIARFWERKTLLNLLIVSPLLLCAACANEINPTGGPRDKTGPEIVKTIPENKTLFFDGNEVTFYFDEFVKPAVYGKEIFISPFQDPKPKITLNNKKIKVKFLEDLLPNTTYVITLTEVKDHFEGNPMKNSYTFAFSTGAVLDSLEIRGRVLKPELGKGQEEMTLLLFDADSVLENDFFDRQPSYITKTTETGNFSFQYLRNSPFKIYGVVDQDQNNRYSQLREIIGISEKPIVVFDSLIQAADSIRKVEAIADSIQADSLAELKIVQDSIAMVLAIQDSLRRDSLGIVDSVQIDSLGGEAADLAKAPADSTAGDSAVEKESEAIFAFRVLYSFLPDDEPPRISGYNWVNPTTIIAKLSEGILPDSLDLSISDTLGNDIQDIFAYTYVPTADQEVLIHSPRIQDSLSSLFFQEMRDSLGNMGDSLLAIIPRRKRKLEKGLFSLPEFDLEKQRFEFVAPVLIDAKDSVNVFVTDTMRPRPVAVVDTATTDSMQVPAVPDSQAVALDSISALVADSLWEPIRVPVQLETDHFRVKLTAIQEMNPKKTYLLNIKGSLIAPGDSVLEDSIFTFPLRWPEKTDFGTLSGSIQIDSAEYYGPIMVELLNESDKPIRTFYDTTFQFTYLKPGKYRFQITLDADSNRVYTPGSLFPYRLPEKIYLHGEPVDIRANWDFEDHRVDVKLKNAGEFAPPSDPEADAEDGEGGPGKTGSESRSFDNRPAGIRPGGR